VFEKNIYMFNPILSVNYEFTLIFQLCTIALVFIKVIAAPVLRNKNYSLAIKVGAMVQRLDQSRGNDDQRLWRSDDQRLDLSTPCSLCRPHLLMMPADGNDA
jgi:hypothetical protein